MARGKRQRFIVPNVGITVESKEIAFTLVHRAIRLYFYDEDILSAHVVAGAAREFIQGQLKSIDKKSMNCFMKEAIEGNKEINDVIVSARQRVYDSLKHFQGKDNPNIEGFTLRETEAVLLEMSIDFIKLYGVTIEVALLVHWLEKLHSPDFLKEVTRK